jgi:hypothetical protein
MFLFVNTRKVRKNRCYNVIYLFNFGIGRLYTVLNDLLYAREFKVKLRLEDTPLKAVVSNIPVIDQLRIPHEFLFSGE